MSSNNLYSLEGFWKNYKFEVCLPNPDLIVEVYEHVREHYMQDGALYKYLKWSEVTEAHTFLIVQNIILQGLSFIVRDADTGKIVGTHLISDNRLGSVSRQIPNFCSRIQAVNDFVENLEDATLETFQALFPEESDPENFTEVYISSVAREHRGQGICSEMFRRTVPFLQSKGLGAMRNTFTDPVTRGVGEKLRFRELGRLYLKDALDANGEKLFSGVDDDAFLTESALIL